MKTCTKRYSKYLADSYSWNCAVSGFMEHAQSTTTGMNTMISAKRGYFKWIMASLRMSTYIFLLMYQSLTKAYRGLIMVNRATTKSSVFTVESTLFTLGIDGCI